MKRIALGAIVLIAMSGIASPAEAVQPPPRCHVVPHSTYTETRVGYKGDVSARTVSLQRCRGKLSVVYGPWVLVPTRIFCRPLAGSSISC